MTAARLFIHRFRRPLAAACAGLAALVIITAARPGEPERVDIVIAAIDLPAGATLTNDDLDLRSIPVDFVTPGALVDPAEAVGRTIASRVDAGEAITPGRLVATGERSDGLHVVPVRLADPEAADLLAPGTTIDLVAIEGEQSGRVIAAAVQVVTVPRPASATGLGGTQRRAGSLIVVAADRRTAVTLAAAGAQPGLGVVMR
jgi:pilus assembly protein CpaB